MGRSYRLSCYALVALCGLWGMAVQPGDGAAPAPEGEGSPAPAEAADTAAPETTTTPDPDAPPAPVPAGSTVLVCTVDGMIDEGIAVVVERAVQEANDIGAAGLIFEVDTFGGRVDSAIAITESIIDAQMPTIAYIVNKGAISAGALISYSCDYIVMAPGTNIGASTVVSAGGEGMQAADEKSQSFVRAKYRALGEQKGHNPILGEAMVDSDIEVQAVRDAGGEWTFYKVADGRPVEQQRAAGQDGEGEQPGDQTEPEPPVPGPSPNMPPGGLERAFRELFEGVEEAERAKEMERAAEEMRNREGDLPEELPDGAVVVTPAGKLLTFTTNEALKFGLIPFVAESLEEVKSYYGYVDVMTQRIEPTWAEELFRFLRNPLISGLLLMLGFGGLYLEIRTPGFGLPGMIGLGALTLFFGSHMVLGLADWVDVALVVIGLGMIGIEVFVLPGFGVLGGLGILSLLVGLYLSLTRVPIPEYEWQVAATNDALLSMATFLTTFVVLTISSIFLLPRSPVFQRLTLADSQMSTSGYTTQSTDDVSAAVGQMGVATTVLRPAGRGRFGARSYDVVTRGEYLDKGCPIRIIRAEGNRYVVEQVNAENA